MNIKKTIGILCVLFITFSSQAQESRKERYEKMKAMKTAYITDQLNLSSADAEKFWPIYNKYDDMRMANRKAMSKLMNSFDDVDDRANMDEKTAEATLKELNSLRKENLKIDQQMSSEMKSVFGANKTLELLIAERSFNGKLMRRMRLKDKEDSKRKRRP